MSSDSTEKAEASPAANPEKFSYCVGRPWPKSPSNPDGTSLNIYMYGGQVKHGTMDEAEGFRDYVGMKTGEENFIYKLVQVTP